MEKMIPDPESYFSRFIPERDELLKALEWEALKEDIPIVGPVVGELLYILARISGARRVLELGTASGYSAIYLAGALRSTGGRLTTVEWDREMAQRAGRNLERAGLGDRVDVLSGDALEVMASLDGPFDMIFMDIDKEYYAGAMPHCRRLLREGGLLVTDNVGFKAADDFNRAVFDRPGWRAVHLLSFLPGHSPERDGLSLALRV